MADIYDAYKPLRNTLRQVSLVESLGVVRAYLQYLQFHQPLPNDIEVIPQFLKARSRPERMVFEWELDTIAREIVINSPESDSLVFLGDLRRWDHFSSTVNKLKDLENAIGGLCPPSSVLLEINRIAHRQFPWQMLPNAIWIGRYYKIFSHPQLDMMVQREVGITTKELYTFGLALTGFYLNTFALDYPPRIEIESISPEKFDLFLKHFSIGLLDLRKVMIEKQQINENYAYTFNPLRQYPLIRMRVRGTERLVAPIPTFLFWRFTSGIYYEICNDADFATPFGESFQNYVGDVISAATRKNPSFVIYPEQEYYVGKDRKNTADWIVENKDSELLIEVKGKRLRLDAKIELLSHTVLTQEIRKMAEFIGQLYATIRDYRNRLYPRHKYNPNKNIFPLIITLENWYLFGPPIEKELHQAVEVEFAKRGLDKNWLDEMPYSICCIEEFEGMIQIMATKGISSFMSKKMNDPEKRLWPFASFMTNEFPDDWGKVKDLFPEVIDEIYPQIRDNDRHSS